MSMVDTIMFNEAYKTEQIAYKLGAEDLRDAILTLYKAVSNGMSPGDMRDLFNTIYVQNVIEGNSGIDIITKVKNWKKEKGKQEEVKFEIGDEIECVNPCYTNYGKKYVVVKTSITGKKQDYIRMISLSSLTGSDTFHKDFYRKTGKHYDSIPIPKGENK